MRSIISQLFQLAKVFTYDVGIDLGTANVRVGLKGKGVVAVEPSVIAVNKITKEILAVGDKAKQMIGKTPGDVVATRPLRDGVIVDFDTTKAMLEHFLKLAKSDIESPSLLSHPRVLVGVPSTITDVEKQAVIDAALSAGAKEAYVIEEPLAAAIGTGLPINEARGNMIVDIGGGTTDIAIISLGGILVDKTIKLAGDELDIKIIDYLREVHGVAVGYRTAERLKIQLGNVLSKYDKEVEPLSIHGRDLTTGLPRTLEVTPADIREAILPVIEKITKAIHEAIEDAPPEIVADLSEYGIVLTGGGSQIRGLDKYWAKKLKIPVKKAKEPQLSVLKGTLIALGHVDLLKRLKEQEETII